MSQFQKPDRSIIDVIQASPVLRWWAANPIVWRFRYPIAAFGLVLGTLLGWWIGDRLVESVKALIGLVAG
jgi:hypothetical protein